jgi:hypothetical protein
MMRVLGRFHSLVRGFPQAHTVSVQWQAISRTICSMYWE